MWTTTASTLRRIASCLLAIAALAALEGCYYAQAVRGQLDIWQRREPLVEVIADPATDPALAERLRLLDEARDFATDALLLPDNGSYRSYADLERDYVLWNVIAAPEFSLTPESWCYLVVGCLAYRGYFERTAAEDFARGLREDGFDVFVGGVAAYSTLGRFDDPILNTMLDRDDADLVALLFHELAHQRLYIDDDTAFNESYASAVAELGLRQWLAGRGEPAAADRWLARRERSAARLAAIEATRERLAALYDEQVDDRTMRDRKAEVFATLRARLEVLDNNANWAAAPLNNAWLASMALYRMHVPAFRALFADCDRQWDCFHERVEALGELPDEERSVALAAATARSSP